jgi:murein DD-endopeptidase MepM/ murein hydrolase activator NlpD
MNISFCKNRCYFLLLAVTTMIWSCKSGSVNLFKSASPHEAYQRKLSSAGLDKTAMGTAWNIMADQSLQKALTITLPFKETGYFAAERVPASAYRFNVTRGQKIKVSLIKNPATTFMIYTDIWEERVGSQPKLLTSADTLGNDIELDVTTTGQYLIRLQPELLRSGSYTLEITTGPSLAFPVQSGRASNVQSFFGDGRDANSRKHEGIDIFGPRLTPVVAIANGTVTRVNQNNLGGNVVWMRPSGKDYTLYYAHLDKQIATEGQQVAVGDTLGLMGNTGNAKTTSPHLHFGIYTSSGAIDPFPFVNPVRKTPERITASLTQLNATVRTTKNVILYQSPLTSSAQVSTLKSGTILRVNAASANWYQVEMPDHTLGFITATAVTATSKPLRKIKIKPAQLNVLDAPVSLAAVKFRLTEGSSAGLLGEFGSYHLIIADDQQTGWVPAF